MRPATRARKNVCDDGAVAPSDGAPDAPDAAPDAARVDAHHDAAFLPPAQHVPPCSAPADARAARRAKRARVAEEQAQATPAAPGASYIRAVTDVTKRARQVGFYTNAYLPLALHPVAQSRSRRRAARARALTVHAGIVTRARLVLTSTLGQ